jgi:hypothetical protein
VESPGREVQPGIPNAGSREPFEPGIAAVGSSGRGKAVGSGLLGFIESQQGKDDGRDAPGSGAGGPEGGTEEEKSPRVRPGRRYGDFTPADKAKSPVESREENFLGIIPSQGGKNRKNDVAA